MTKRTKSVNLLELAKAIKQLNAQERREVDHFIQFLEARRTDKDPRKFEDYMGGALGALSQVELMRHQTYTFELLQKMNAYNQMILIPSLKHVLGWTKVIEKDVKQLEAKKRRAEQKRAKAGKP